MSKLFTKTRNAAEDAQVLFGARRYDSACNRAYYAMFNAARALLLLRGHDREKAKTHATVLQLFSLEFVRDGLFDPEDGRALRLAGRTRSAADYADDETEEEAARAVIQTLQRFMATAENIFANLAGTEEGGP